MTNETEITLREEDEIPPAKALADMIDLAVTMTDFFAELTGKAAVEHRGEILRDARFRIARARSSQAKYTGMNRP